MGPLITLTTDFGQGSPYVAQMKGVIYAHCRQAEIVDITHGIRPQHIREGALVLADVTPRFPPGTIHVAVVDPGVGTSRKLVYAEFGGQRYLAPDNGLLTLVSQLAPRGEVISLERPDFWAAEVSPTFHGRDILAPVAGHLACGLAPAKLGPPLVSLLHVPIPQPRLASDRALGEVLLIDSFGNLITNVRVDQLPPAVPASEVVVECKGRTIVGLQDAYELSPSGTLVALVDSQGRLEIAAVRGSAAAVLSASEGTAVVARWPAGK
ncbi:MAG TPA: SAM-dependent chlorinase/fluorinase [Pirellulaceae bacterium]|nr:SAM-dependent chlorinase/fluorinase [Pirellulaceae bacterium]